MLKAADLSCIIGMMKRPTSTAPALFLAALGSVVILGITALIAFGALFTGALGNMGKPPCQHCINAGPFTNETVAIGTVGLIVAAVAFWGIVRSMRPPRK